MSFSPKEMFGNMAEVYFQWALLLHLDGFKGLQSIDACNARLMRAL